MPRTTPPAETSATPDASPATLDPDRLIRVSSILVVVAVAIGAGIVSYGHAYELVHSHGESGTAAVVGPATVDGLIYASGMVLLQAARRRVKPPPLAFFGLWLGIAATIGANVAHGVDHGRIGALVSAWPAVALIVSYELLMKIIRSGPGKAAELVEDHDDATTGHCPHGVAEVADEAVRVRYLHARDCLGEELSQRQLSDAFGVDRKKVAELVPETKRTRGRTEPVEAPQPEPVRHTDNGHAPVGAMGELS